MDGVSNEFKVNPFTYNKFINSVSSNDLESFQESPRTNGIANGPSSDTASNKSDDRYEIIREATDFQSFSDEVSNPTPSPPKPKVSPDLFKDFAERAFSEFKHLNPPHEFANQMLFFNKKSSIQNTATNGNETGKSLFGDQPKVITMCP